MLKVIKMKLGESEYLFQVFESATLYPKYRTLFIEDKDVPDTIIGFMKLEISTYKAEDSNDYFVLFVSEDFEQSKHPYVVERLILRWD